MLFVRRTYLSFQRIPWNRSERNNKRENLISVKSLLKRARSIYRRECVLYYVQVRQCKPCCGRNEAVQVVAVGPGLHDDCSMDCHYGYRKCVLLSSCLVVVFCGSLEKGCCWVVIAWIGRIDFPLWTADDRLIGWMCVNFPSKKAWQDVIWMNGFIHWVKTVLGILCNRMKYDLLFKSTFCLAWSFLKKMFFYLKKMFFILWAPKTFTKFIFSYFFSRFSLTFSTQLTVLLKQKIIIFPTLLTFVICT